VQVLAPHPWPNTYETEVAPPSIVAETLTADLIHAGGLGQFVIDLTHTWNDLTETERLQAAWEDEHGTDMDPEVFRRETLSQLQGVSLGMMARATGLSKQYCSLTRRGKYVPHRRHWIAIRNISETE